MPSISLTNLIRLKDFHIFFHFEAFLLLCSANAGKLSISHLIYSVRIPDPVTGFEQLPALDGHMHAMRFWRLKRGKLVARVRLGLMVLACFLLLRRGRDRVISMASPERCGSVKLVKFVPLLLMFDQNVNDPCVLQIYKSRIVPLVPSQPVLGSLTSTIMQLTRVTESDITLKSIVIRLDIACIRFIVLIYTVLALASQTPVTHGFRTPSNHYNHAKYKQNHPPIKVLFKPCGMRKLC